ncbi:cytochrome P450 [Coniochaeta sp. 2T2.1]|nr:cytochrome P450 [Coniochaeta sp. 2T2.1]
MDYIDHSFEGVRGIISVLISRNAFVLGGIIAASIYLLDFILSPRLDPREPPLVKPSFPLIGHIVGLLRHQNQYHQIVQEKHPLPIATLQMLWGKLYAVWDPALAQAVLRAPQPSVEPFFIDFAAAVFGSSKETVQKIKDRNEHGLIQDFGHAVHNSMNPAALRQMNMAVLKFVGETFSDANGGSDGVLQYDNMWLWIKDLITIPTTRALYGRENPFDKDPPLTKTAWDFEENMASLLMTPFPSLLARKAYQARAKLQAAMVEWFTAEHDVTDSTVGGITRDRARVLRTNGFSSDEIGKVEMILAIAGVTNSAPTLFWMIAYVYARPYLVAMLRDEMDAFVHREKTTGSGDIATIKATNFEAQCPLLTSCFRETLRLSCFGVSSRRLVADATVTDSNGHPYLLKKGVDIQVPVGVPHRLENVWDNTAAKFDYQRFLEKKGARNGTSEKAKKTAYIPFGGGRHLCPGRSFALTEVMSIMGTLLAGFEVESLGLSFSDVKLGPPRMTTAVVKPLNEGAGLGVRITRRKGWEQVQWKYEC